MDPKKNKEVITEVPEEIKDQDVTEKPAMTGKPEYTEKELALMAEIERLKTHIDSLPTIPQVETGEPENPKSVDDWLKEKVPFQAFKDNDKYKEDIHVGINGYNYVIQRGKKVMIPRYVYMAIDDSDKQTLVADTNADEKSKEFETKSKLVGITN